MSKTTTEFISAANVADYNTSHYIHLPVFQEGMDTSVSRAQSPLPHAGHRKRPCQTDCHILCNRSDDPIYTLCTCSLNRQLQTEWYAPLYSLQNHRQMQEKSETLPGLPADAVQMTAVCHCPPAWI